MDEIEKIKVYLENLNKDEVIEKWENACLLKYLDEPIRSNVVYSFEALYYLMGVTNLDNLFDEIECGKLARCVFPITRRIIGRYNEELTFNFISSEASKIFHALKEHSDINNEEISDLDFSLKFCEKY